MSSIGPAARLSSASSSPPGLPMSTSASFNCRARQSRDRDERWQTREDATEPQRRVRYGDVGTGGGFEAAQCPKHCRTRGAGTDSPEELAACVAGAVRTLGLAVLGPSAPAPHRHSPVALPPSIPSRVTSTQSGSMCTVGQGMPVKTQLGPVDNLASEREAASGVTTTEERSMNANGWRMADSDMHIMEPPDLWQRYIDPAWLERGAHRAERGATRHARTGQGHVLSISTRERVPQGLDRRRRMEAAARTTAYAHAEDRGWDATSQLEAMDAEGLDAAVLFPSRGLFVLGLDTVEQAGDAPGYEPGLAAAVARAYNDWLHDFCAEDPTRLFGAGLLAPHDIDAAADEVKRVVQDYGFKTVFLHPGCVNGMPWHHPDYDPIWRACEELERADQLPRWRSELPAPRLHARSVRQPDDVAHVRAATRDHGGGRELRERRRDPALPEPARRVARRELRLGAVAAAPARRALGVDGRRPTLPTSSRRRRSSSGRTAS